MDAIIGQLRDMGAFARPILLLGTSLTLHCQASAMPIFKLPPTAFVHQRPCQLQTLGLTGYSLIRSLQQALGRQVP
jgi:hypothetical protein